MAKQNQWSSFQINIGVAAGSFLLSLCCVSSSWAGVVTVNGTAVRAETMQAFTAVADDPSAIYYNPAGLTQVKGTEVDSSYMLILPNVKYSNSAMGGLSTGSTRVSFGPNLFISTDKVNPVTLGLGLYAPFARATRYPINLATYNAPLNSSLLRLDLAPTVAYEVNPYLSIGAGLIVSRIAISQDVFGFSERGLGYGVTGQAGVLVKLNKQFKVGVDYRGPMTARINGTGSVATFSNNSFSTRLPFPGMLSAGFAWQITDPLLFSFSYEYEMWSRLRSITRQYANPIINTFSTTTLNAKNVGDYRFGLAYKPDNEYEYRVGYSYFPTALPASSNTPVIPDFNTHVFSIGYSRYFKKWRFDVGYEYCHMIPFTGTQTLFPGTYHAGLNTVMLGVAYTI